MFDQLPNLSQTRPIISYTSSIPSSHDHIFTSVKKPEKPKLFHECMSSPIKQCWIAACFRMFEKNRKLAVFSLPVPISSLPPTIRVFPTILVPDIKPTDIPTLWECKIRDCTVGTKQEKGIDFPESYTPVGEATTLKVLLAVSAAINNIFGVVDVQNAFQTSIAPNEYRIWVTVPKIYLTWLQLTGQIESFDPSERYARQ